MEQFAEDWLRLREPFDRAARSPALGRAFLASVAPGATILDLGAGNGANARYLESLARHAVHWRLVDGDAALLHSVSGVRGAVDTQCLDLARHLDRMDVAHLGGITAAAFCDLVSARWLDALTRRAARHRLPMLFALTVDGRLRWSPPDAADGIAMAAFRRDQQRDKGFGAALGPAAPWHMTNALRRFGYRVRVARSDWRVPATATAMLDAMLTGVAGAARADAKKDAGDIEAWFARRQTQAAAGALSLTVGHRDCLAVMPSRAG
ncbi:MAG: class I SAM-dependent methyltransferase [Alphaproteobacteria bacterium]|nr:class I SAM-dependent methyltransferase [Alphaproteobacteria bacterium]